MSYHLVVRKQDLPVVPLCFFYLWQFVISYLLIHYAHVQDEERKNSVKAGLAAAAAGLVFSLPLLYATQVRGGGIQQRG